MKSISVEVDKIKTIQIASKNKRISFAGPSPVGKSVRYLNLLNI